MSDIDIRFMRLAIELSRRGLGATAENPPVGCVIVRDDSVVGRGFTARKGRPHAEVIALAQAGENSRGATAYVTLEPCCHHGKTPPCSLALIEAGISRVVCALNDPDDRVNGKGLEQLCASNIEVVANFCANEAQRVLAGYLSRRTTNKPSVLLKLAISRDEKVASNNSRNRWITGPLARERGHLMRAQCDAILVGIGTVLEDNPRLSCRLNGLQDLSPIRVIVDTHLNTPLHSKLVESAREIPVMIMCSQNIEINKSLKLLEKGVEVIPCSLKSDRVDLTDMLSKLADHGINRLLVEGGAKIAEALVDDRLVDELAIFKAPIDIGPEGTAAFASRTLSGVVKKLSMVEDYKLKIGPDELNLYHRSVDSN